MTGKFWNNHTRGLELGSNIGAAAAKRFKWQLQFYQILWNFFIKDKDSFEESFRLKRSWDPFITFDVIFSGKCPNCGVFKSWRKLSVRVCSKNFENFFQEIVVIEFDWHFNRTKCFFFAHQTWKDVYIVIEDALKIPNLTFYEVSLMNVNCFTTTNDSEKQ